MLGFDLLSRLSRAWYEANVGAGSAQLADDPLIASEASLQNVDLSPEAASGLAAEVIRESWLDALSGTFVIVAVLLALAFVMALLLREAPLSTTSEDKVNEADATELDNGGSEQPAV